MDRDIFPSAVEPESKPDLTIYVHPDEREAFEERLPKMDRASSTA